MNNQPTSPVLAYLPSFFVALHTGAIWGHCYENCYRAFFAFPDLFFPDGKFVEGWAVMVDSQRVILMEHGWLVSSMMIIDPTLALGIAPDQSVFFYPGVIRSWAETDRLENELFPHVRFSGYGEDGMEHSGYKAAYIAAQEQAQSLLTDNHKLVEVRAADPPTTQEQGEENNSVEVVLYILTEGRRNHTR